MKDHYEDYLEAGVTPLGLDCPLRDGQVPCAVCPFYQERVCVYYDHMPLPYLGKTVKETDEHNT